MPAAELRSLLVVVVVMLILSSRRSPNAGQRVVPQEGHVAKRDMPE